MTQVRFVFQTTNYPVSVIIFMNMVVRRSMNNPAAADRLSRSSSSVLQHYLCIRDCCVAAVAQNLQWKSKIKMHSKSTAQPGFLFTPPEPETSAGDIISDTTDCSYSCSNSQGKTRSGQTCENVRTKCKKRQNSLAEFHML